MPHELDDVKWSGPAGVNLWAMVRWRKTRPTHVSRYFSLQTFLSMSCSYQENGILVFIAFRFSGLLTLFLIFSYGKLIFSKGRCYPFRIPIPLALLHNGIDACPTERQGLCLFPSNVGGGL